MSAVRRRQVYLRKTAGWVWLLTWLALLYAVASPWRDLGGIVEERLRWLESCVLFGAIPIGFTVGLFARRAAEQDARRTHARLLRLVFLPPAALFAAGTLLLEAFGRRDAIGVLFTAFLSYWAGVDLAFGAVPLMKGKSYRFAFPLEPETDDLASLTEKRRERPWVPPWERV